MCRESLSNYNLVPMEMRAYLRNYGHSFSKRACEYAVSQMKRKNKATGALESIDPLSKEKVEEMLAKNGIRLDNNIGYNFVYIANMIMADSWKSSIEDELHLCREIKNRIDDPDGDPKDLFSCWITRQENRGIPIPWEQII